MNAFVKLDAPQMKLANLQEKRKRRESVGETPSVMS
jgi:hypothetical protein